VQQGGERYKYIGDVTTYAEALQMAAATSINGVAGHLVTVEDEDEDAFLRSHYATAATGATGGMWLSGSDASTEGTWAWTSGNLNQQTFWQGNAPVSDRFTNWGAGEPQQGSQDCLIMDGEGLWADVPCGSAGGPRRVVAKYPRLLTTTTTLTTTTQTRTSHTVDADQHRSIHDLNSRLDATVNAVSDLTATVSTLQSSMENSLATIAATQSTNSASLTRIRQAIASVVQLLPEGSSDDGGAAAPAPRIAPSHRSKPSVQTSRCDVFDIILTRIISLAHQHHYHGAGSRGLQHEASC